MKALDLLEWKSLGTAPRDGTWVELRGESGMRGYPYRVMIGRYEKDRENPNWVYPHNEENCWRNVHGDHCTEDGSMPTHWRPVS